MLKIGFIDLFLDEWHADNYVSWIEEASEGRFRVSHAYADREPTEEGKRSNSQFCKDHGLELVHSLDELIAASDCIIVLAPDHPEEHVRLARQALQSGKPVYVDKTFANTAEEAQYLFELAEQHGTPLFSSSALRFSQAYTGLPENKIHSIVSYGGGTPEHYVIHQLEPLMMLLKSRVTRGMSWGSEGNAVFLLEFLSNQRVTVIQNDHQSFGMTVSSGDQVLHVKADDDYFAGLIRSMLAFFETALAGRAVSPVDAEQTVAIIAARELILQSMTKPGEWIE